MAEDIALNVRNTKLPAYEQIDGSAPSRRRRVAFLLGGLALVLTIVAASVYGSGLKTSGPANDASVTTPSPVSQVTTQGACELSGTTFRTLNIAGITRSYRVHIPSGITFPASLVVSYHGISSDVTKIEAKMKLIDFETSAPVKSVLVYPEAKNKGGGLLDPAAFNGASCCKDAADFKDEEFFAAIVKELTDMGCVNGAKVYVQGFSNGGFMTNRLACAAATTDLVTAACVHSGLNGDYNGVLANSPWMNCKPKSILSIHGSSDTTVPIGGGKNPISPARWFSQDQITDMWATGCDAPTTVVTGSKTRTTRQCGSRQVVSIKHEGFGHDWHVDSTVDCMAFFDAQGGL